MKYLDEFRDPQRARALLAQIHQTLTRPWTVMEVCGSQTHNFLRYGIPDLLPGDLELVHGPGCPVCVTPVEIVDQAVALAQQPEVILLSYGDMLRVPGTRDDLLTVKARGGDVRMVYSPLEAVRIARQNPQRQVVFLAIGFETTAPANAAAVLQARQQGLQNLYFLVSQVRVPPALEALLQDPEVRVQGFLAPGHVTTVMGYQEYEPIAETYRVPIVVTGFEPVDLLMGLLELVRHLEAGEYGVWNAYRRSVRREGNPLARKHMLRVFEICDMKWRGLGWIPRSGLCLREAFRDLDARHAFQDLLADLHPEESPECIAGLVLKGIKKPTDCPAFGTRCTPQTPLGAPMVSSEGACAAYYRYGRLAKGT